MDDVRFDERLEYWMDRAGMNGRQLAAALDMAESTVSGWRSGGKTPTLGAVDRIAEVFGITVSEFWRPISAAEIKRLRGEAA